MTLSDDFYDPVSKVSHPSQRAPWVPRPRVPSNTRAAWAIALMPLAGMAINLGVGVAQGFMTWFAIGVVSVLLWVLTVILARVDRRELDAWGFENTASPWLVLLTPPVYLAARGNRVWKRTGSGFGPLWGSVAVLVCIPIAFGATGVLGSVWSELQRVYAELGM
jgi:hypothetical protein